MSFSLNTTVYNRLSQGNFIVIGRAGLDLYPYPAGTDTKDAQKFESDLGGSAANIAVSLSRLGCNAFLCSTFADDSVGNFIMNKLYQYKVNTKYCTTISGVFKNSLALAENKSQNPKVVIYRNNASDLQISKDIVKTIDFELISGLIVTGTSLSSEPSRSSVLLAINLAQEKKCPIIIDLDYRQDAWESENYASREIEKVTKLSDICIGNEDEFNVLGSKNNLDGKELALKLSENGKLVIYKKGSLGSELIYMNSQLSVNAFKVKVLKPFGAGDAFMGGFLSSLSNGTDLKQAITFGSATAAIVVSKFGCSSAMPSYLEVKNFIKNNH